MSEHPKCRRIFLLPISMFLGLLILVSCDDLKEDSLGYTQNLTIQSPAPTYTPLPTYPPLPTYTPLARPTVSSLQMPTPLSQTVVPLIPTATPLSFQATRIPQAGSYIDEEFYENIQVDVEGEFLPAMENRFDPAVGLTAPLIKGVDLAGNPIVLQEDAETTIVIALAHWCPHCRNEVRELASYFLDNPLPEGIRVVSIATSINPTRANYPPHKWFENEQWNIPVIVDNSDSDIARAMGVSSFPFFIVIDSNGDVSLRVAGRLGIDGLERIFELITTKSY